MGQVETRRVDPFYHSNLTGHHGNYFVTPRSKNVQTTKKKRKKKAKQKERATEKNEQMTNVL